MHGNWGCASNSYKKSQTNRGGNQFSSWLHIDSTMHRRFLTRLTAMEDKSISGNAEKNNWNCCEGGGSSNTRNGQIVARDIVSEMGYGKSKDGGINQVVVGVEKETMEIEEVMKDMDQNDDAKDILDVIQARSVEKNLGKILKCKERGVVVRTG